MLLLLLYQLILSAHAAVVPPDQILNTRYTTVDSLPSSLPLPIRRNSADLAAQPRQESCWELITDGRRLHPQFIVRSVRVSSLQDCQRECEEVLFNCETIAYGENRFKGGNVTCDLSDWDAASLSLQPTSTDTVATPGFSVYSRYGREPNRVPDDVDDFIGSSGSEHRNRCNNQNRPGTSTNKNKEPPIVLNRPDSLHKYHHGAIQNDPTASAIPSARPQNYISISEDVCYTILFTGRRLSQRYIERSVAVISLDECKLLCTRETSFDCRSFNYKRRGLSTNCDLSREDAASLDVSSSYVFFQDPDVDYYQRVGKGHSCYRPYRPTSSSSTYYENNRPLTAALSDCYRRVKSGYRLDSRIVRDSINVRGLYECETECQRSRTFLCRSFSFRTISNYNSVLNNCELSDIEPRDLDPVRHLVVDRDADIFERNAAGRNCRETALTVWNNHRPVKPTGLCFLRTKTGIRLDRRAVRYTLSVNSPIECEQECINAQFFTCRSFSYRYSAHSLTSDAYHKAYDNCDLSDVDIGALDPLRDLIDDRLYDTWQRTSYRNCDLYTNTFRTPSIDPQSLLENDFSIADRQEDDDDLPVSPWTYPSRRPIPHYLSGALPSRCFSTFRRGFRMNPRLVRDAIRVRTQAECEIECNRARPFVCQTFHFRYSNLNGGYERNPYNCELSDMPARDFDRYHGDIMDDRDYEIFTRSQFSSCTSSYPSTGLYDYNTNLGLMPTGFEISPIMSGSIGGSYSMDVTVSGYRCRWGSRCRPHRDLGYWYCEVAEDNLANSNWDYCCQPQSRCGYSEGFNYPWCYVGAELSGQWRPCSDRFAERPYAYLHRSSPPNMTESTAPEFPAAITNGLGDTNRADFNDEDHKNQEPTVVLLDSNSFESQPARSANPSGSPNQRYVVKSNCANKTGDEAAQNQPTP